jgi:hypothetical protein
MLSSRDSHATDPVAMSRVIAASLLRDLRASRGAQIEYLSVVNLIRMLEIYANGGFYARQPLGILERDDFANINSVGEADRYECLQTAMRATHEAISPQSAPKDFAAEFSNLFSHIGKDDSRPQAETVERLDTFLTRFTQSLATS